MFKSLQQVIIQHLFQSVSFQIQHMIIVSFKYQKKSKEWNMI